MTQRAAAFAATLCACALALTAPSRAQTTAAERLHDFDTMWRAIDADYAFAGGHDAWRRARETWRPRAASAASREQFVAALRGALDTLRDDGVSIEGDGVAAVRIPYDIDVWPRWSGGEPVIEAVRVFSDADVAGMRPGQRLTQVGEVSIDRAIRDRLGGRPRNAAEAEWALRRIFAERNPRVPRPPALPLLSAHRIGEERDLGYLRLRLGIPEPRFEEKLDAALEQLSDTRGLIVDLRDNTAPVPHSLTRAVLARFERRESSAPVVVLVDRWTAGEGEALAQGLRTIARAQLIGTRTAGVRAGTRQVELPASGLVITYPDGKPRQELVPDTVIDLAAPKGGPGDPILYQALMRLRSSSAPARRTAPR